MFANNDEHIMKKSRIGEILLKENKVDKFQLQEALTAQQVQKKPLGKVLVDLGYIDQHDVMVALIKQCRLPYIAIDEYDIDKELIKMIPKETAEKNHAVPLGRVGNVLSMVMQDPLNKDMREEFQRLTNCEIASFISTKEQIDRAIKHCYGEDD